jgi:hypothetical protein
MKEQILKLIQTRITVFEKELLDTVQELEKFKAAAKPKPEENNIEGLKKIMSKFPQLPLLQSRILSGKVALTELKNLRAEIERIDENGTAQAPDTKKSVG